MKQGKYKPSIVGKGNLKLQAHQQMSYFPDICEFCLLWWRSTSVSFLGYRVRNSWATRSSIFMLIKNADNKIRTQHAFFGVEQFYRCAMTATTVNGRSSQYILSTPNGGPILGQKFAGSWWWPGDIPILLGNVEVQVSDDAARSLSLKKKKSYQLMYSRLHFLGSKSFFLLHSLVLLYWLSK